MTHPSTTGQRVRVLLEWYDPNAFHSLATVYAWAREAELSDRYPGAVVAVYVEQNPPPDEVQGLPATVM
ncbi:hypothetical protein ETD86_45770 [Nonomuraea turkmeniaca]|uniref:Uncharacterized protein n=1 Tax=Nonomuraea turkmeniaca TaxID=103838 RepID=A0A5S4FIK8_9ACTN|nr:hypothetical protein [Nonomuraea turkmeniaca]TMR08884.1 hypothetical protein ETD86_45770 [Nonomuraea turkmeniaca]